MVILSVPVISLSLSISLSFITLYLSISLSLSIDLTLSIYRSLFIYLSIKLSVFYLSFVILYYLSYQNPPLSFFLHLFLKTTEHLFHLQIHGFILRFVTNGCYHLCNAKLLMDIIDLVF